MDLKKIYDMVKDLESDITDMAGTLDTLSHYTTAAHEKIKEMWRVTDSGGDIELFPEYYLGDELATMLHNLNCLRKNASAIEHAICGIESLEINRIMDALEANMEKEKEKEE